MRFMKVAANGLCVPDDAKDHVACIDKSNGLIWTARNVGGRHPNWNAANDAANACTLLSLDGWRLPTVEELFALADRTRTDPAIDVDAFPGTEPSWYWSSSPWAGSPVVCAWGVLFSNGYAFYSRRDNYGFCRAVRSVSPAPGECQGVPLRALYHAWRAARRRKRPSHNQVQFETRWIDGLLQLQERLERGTWSPSPSTCFVARRPKAREIHAPDFADRVVHHWLVPQLEAVFEPGFIYDSYSNRAGKGTHAAVRRLQQLTREVYSGQGGGWYLQLDVANFFNSIHRPTLWRRLRARMERASVPTLVQRTAHALLRRPPLAAGVTYRGTRDERALVPRHKRLEAAAPGCGLPIGNLSSQFFANVYLDALDQFVKRTLRAPRYVRYVDDFVLVHRDREQLVAWKAQIEDFLRRELRLELKADIRLRQLVDGVDFLGYVVRPSHLVVRSRVLQHARDALRAWELEHVRGAVATASPAGFRAIASTWASYTGHVAHAAAARSLARIRKRFPWVAPIAETTRRFSIGLEGRRVAISFGGSTA